MAQIDDIKVDLSQLSTDELRDRIKAIRAARLTLRYTRPKKGKSQAEKALEALLKSNLTKDQIVELLKESKDAT